MRTDATVTTTQMSLGEHLIVTLTQAWREIRTRHPEVPDVMLTVGSGTIGRPRGKVTLGHFAAERWTPTEGPGRTHELFIGGEGLARGSRGLLETLLHEAAHALAQTRTIKDTSRQGRYHNQRFKALAEELGLRVREDPSTGWSPSELPAETAAAYADVLDSLTVALRTHRISEHDGQNLTPGGEDEDNPTGDGAQGEEPQKPSTNLAVAICGCEKPRKIRVARSSLAVAPIICGACGEEFSTAGEKAPTLW